MPFRDEIDLHLRAGKGGDGLVHFARVKYQPFAGPDGGDGGRGGSVALLCDKAVDDLDHLRHVKTEAPAGQPGGPNFRIGANAADLELRVPPGTLVYDGDTHDELTALTATGQRYIAAQGGDGGKGNPKYATGRRRAPKLAEPGSPGEELAAHLVFRLYCDTLLIEAEGDPEWMVLPRLLQRDSAEIDWELYRRKPRWVRLEYQFEKYDVGYLPAMAAEEAEPLISHLPHVFWPRRIVLTACAAEDAPLAALGALVQSQPRRRLERLVCIARQPASVSGAQVQVAASPAALEQAFLQQLTGGTVS